MRLRIAYIVYNLFAFQSTHPLRGATYFSSLQDTAAPVSIHAPPARCDKIVKMHRTNDCCFNPRTPCEVRRPWILIFFCPIPFQSTHPLRGATISSYVFACRFCFNPRTPCEVRQDIHYFNPINYVSIHAPPARCDPYFGPVNSRLPSFNPRTPCEVRPLSALIVVLRVSGFNPRTPCEVRLKC